MFNLPMGSLMKLFGVLHKDIILACPEENTLKKLLKLENSRVSYHTWISIFCAVALKKLLTIENIKIRVRYSCIKIEE